MSNFRKLKSKINKKFLNIGKKAPIPKGLDKSSKRVTFSITPLDYNFYMEEYDDYGNIFIELKEESDRTFTLLIGGGFGKMFESEEYIELNNQVNGAMKDILKFFDEFTKELNYDFTSINKLTDFLICYK